MNPRDQSLNKIHKTCLYTTSRKTNAKIRVSPATIRTHLVCGRSAIEINLTTLMRTIPNNHSPFFSSQEAEDFCLQPLPSVEHAQSKEKKSSQRLYRLQQTTTEIQSIQRDLVPPSSNFL